jgi:hypothetical protein
LDPFPEGPGECTERSTNGSVATPQQQPTLMAKWMMKGSITAVLGSEDALNAQMWSRLVNS